MAHDMVISHGISIYLVLTLNLTIMHRQVASAAELSLLVDEKDERHFNMHEITKYQGKSKKVLKKLAKKGIIVEVW